MPLGSGRNLGGRSFSRCMGSPSYGGNKRTFEAGRCQVHLRLHSTKGGTLRDRRVGQVAADGQINLWGSGTKQS